MAAKREDLIGEKRLNNDGLEMIIIDAVNTHNLTVKFTESGNIREKVYYVDFCRGMVKDRTKRTRKKIIGQKKVMNCGSVCEVIDYFPGSKTRYCRVMVKFENGCIKTVNYNRFIRGDISDKGRCGGKRRILLNTEGIAKSGEKYKVIFEDEKYCRIKFANGVEKTYSRRSIIHNSVSGSGGHKRPCKKYLVGDTLISEGGKKYVITNRYGNYVDVINEEGNIEIRKQVRDILIRKERVLVDRVKEVIGEKSLTCSLNECEIVGGTRLGDLDIKLSNGTVLHHQRYDKFKNGKIYEKTYSNAELVQMRKQREYVGKVVLQSCGLEAKCIQYNNRKDIIVEFSDGTRRKTDTYHFNKGMVSYNSNIKKGSLSMNEYTLRESFKNAGFIKMPSGSLRYLDGFKNMELDLYHPKYKIAIEYDGYYHHSENSVKKDILKDKVCQIHGITIYRIREETVPLLNDGISIEYQLKDSHHFNPDLIKTFKRLKDDISKKTGLEIVLPDLECTAIRNKLIQNYGKNDAYLSKIGEIRYNHNGERMEIFEYLNCNSVGIIFDNGYTTYRSYSAFKKGDIKCLYNHYGEESISKNGEKMKIISTCFGQKIDVEFEDGTIVRDQFYNYFLKGLIANPNYQKNKDLSHIHEIVETKCGLLAEIIEIRRVRNGKQSVLRVICRFEDGEISTETEYNHFLDGYVKHPIIKCCPDKDKIQTRAEAKKQLFREKAMSKTYISVDGYKFKVIDYKDSNHIRIKFDDDFELNSSMGMIQSNKIYRFLSKNIKRNV